MKSHVPSPSLSLLRQLCILCAETRPTNTRISTRTTCIATCGSRSRLKSTSSARQSPLHANTRSSSTLHTSHPQPQPQSSAATTLPDITTFYTIFPHTLPRGPPPTGPFDVPIAELRREFLQLQSQHHPDKYTSSSHARPNFHALSTLINEAYKTLSDPLLRAQYLLLHSHNIDVTSEDNSTHVADPSTLMEVMDAQEAIEDAHDETDIQKLRDQNAARIEETVTKMARAFETGDVEGARSECVRLKYWRSLQDGLREWEPGREVRLIH